MKIPKILRWWTFADWLSSAVTEVTSQRKEDNGKIILPWEKYLIVKRNRRMASEPQVGVVDIARC